MVADDRIDLRPKARKSTSGLVLTRASTIPLLNPAGDIAGGLQRIRDGGADGGERRLAVGRAVLRAKPQLLRRARIYDEGRGSGHRLEKLADEVGTDIQYYEYLDTASRRLNAPGAGRLVDNESFGDVVENIDSCIDFMENHVSCCAE